MLVSSTRRRRKVSFFIFSFSRARVERNELSDKAKDVAYRRCGLCRGEKKGEGTDDCHSHPSLTTALWFCHSKHAEKRGPFTPVKESLGKNFQFLKRSFSPEGLLSPLPPTIRRSLLQNMSVMTRPFTTLFRPQDARESLGIK